MATPHINAENGQFAKTVIMPGDPLRAKMIAETYLEESVLVTQIRNMLGYTGKYKGKEISVMGSGMGMPSIGIYSYELFTEFEVDSIIRVGSAGAYIEDLHVGDIVLADSAWSESSYAKTMSNITDEIMYPDERLNEKIKAAAASLGRTLKIGRVHSSDVFYRKSYSGYHMDLVRDEKVSVVEMESFALFHNASVLGKKAACLVTVSDSFVRPEIMTAEERQNSLGNMIEIALEAYCL